MNAHLVCDKTKAIRNMMLILILLFLENLRNGYAIIAVDSKFLIEHKNLLLVVHF